MKAGNEGRKGMEVGDEGNTYKGGVWVPRSGIFQIATLSSPYPEVLINRMNRKNTMADFSVETRKQNQPMSAQGGAIDTC